MEITRRAALKRIALGSTAVAFAGTATADGGQRYLVRLDDAEARSRIRELGFAASNRLADGTVLSVVGEADAADELRAADGVAAAVPDVEFELEGPEHRAAHDHEPGDGSGADGDLPELFEEQWAKHVTRVLDAHDVTAGEGARIAIIDSGVDEDHVDLGSLNRELSTAIVDGEHREHVGDSFFHGTHVAGIAAATGAEGVLGTAPAADLVSLRIGRMPYGFFQFSDVVLAVEHAAEIGADAANLSLGTLPLPPGEEAGEYRRVMEPVVQYATRKGTVVVTAAGNSAADLQHGGTALFPNSLAGTLGVSATGPNDELSHYSNYGTNAVAVGAPGGGYETLEKTRFADDVEYPYPTNLVLSTLPGDDYARLAGTSMAAPHVTGIAALVRSVAPDLTAGQVERAVARGAALVDGQGDPELGAGRVDAAGAVAAAQSLAGGQ